MIYNVVCASKSKTGVIVPSDNQTISVVSNSAIGRNSLNTISSVEDSFDSDKSSNFRGSDVAATNYQGRRRDRLALSISPIFLFNVIGILFILGDI